MNVLIVDDDRSTQRVLADALTKQGFVVTVERDGDWALKTFEKKAFDAVLLDLLLPGLNGYEVAKQIRKTPRGRRTPIFMISGVYKSAIHQREAVQKHGATAFLEKPVDLEELYRALQDALGDRYPSEPDREDTPPPPAEDDHKTGEFMADDAQREEAHTVENEARANATSPGFSLRGVFDSKSFAEVLAEVYRWRASGALLLKRRNVKKIVYFRDGTPEVVKSNLLVECLGRVLVRHKMISEAECEESLGRMKKSKRMQGTVLIEMGCISPHNLQHALKLQLQEKLFDVFRWDDGEFQLNPKAPVPPDPVGVGMTCGQLILEGVKRAYDEERLARVFSGVDDKYVYPSDQPLYALQDVGLGDEERELLQVADGRKTVGTLRALGVLEPLETDRLLYAMSCAQMIELKDTPAAGKPKVPISRIADSAKPPPPLPASVPPPLPSMPPPLPQRSTAPPPANVPWDSPSPPPRAQPRPPPVPDATPPPVQKKKGKKAPEPVVAKAGGSLLPELSEVMAVDKLSSSEANQRERLAAKVAAMRDQNYYEILGLKTSASREDIKRAYFVLAKEYHPDKHFSSASAEVRHLAQQLYDLISQAHDTLNDPQERERYTRELAKGVKRDMGGDVGKILAAEGKFQRGEELMRQRNFDEAVKSFEDAIALYGDEGEFHAWLGWAIFQQDPDNSDAAVKELEAALRLNPKLDKTYLFLGYIQKATGRPDKAEKQFERAIQCNPDCTEALRELRLLGKTRR